MAPGIFLTAAAGALGWHSPWALAGGLAGVTALGGLALLLRPLVLWWSRPQPAVPAPRG